MEHIIITGGGSGGHIAPVRAIAKELQKKYKLVWLGSSDFEKYSAKNLRISFHAIFSGKMRRGFNLYNFLKNAFDFFNLIIGCIQSYILLVKYKPEKIFSTGGFVSVPVVLAAAVLNIPIIIHEQTIGFGLANKIGSLFASKILLAFPESKKYINKKYHHKIEIVGNPIREDLLNGNHESLEKFLGQKLSVQKPLLYITGGGQGSAKINNVLWGLLPSLAEKFYIIHQCGASGIQEGKKYEKQTQDYFAFDFIGEELADIYACSDVVIARAGAGTVNELAHFGIYAIFVPLRPVQNDEQTKNAEWFLRENKGLIIEQDVFSGSYLLLELENIRYHDLHRNRENICKISESAEKIIHLLYS